jgi:lysophospholipase L1-like esterase
MKRIVAYGDSWTIGEGCNREIEDTLSKHEKIIYQKENSWVRHLSDKLNIPFENNGISGNPNNKIYNQIVDDVKNGLTTKHDLVIIMWSSSLRDYLPFLPHGPKGEWLSWSTKHLIETPDRFFTSTQTENRYYDFFMEDYKKFFLLNLHSDLYYSIINQNYIIFLQQFLNHYKIKHLMCDGIEDMFLGIEPLYDKTNLIDANSYWGCREKTMRDFLIEFNDYDMWEYKERWDTRGTQHPNSKGYQLIADELYRFINQNSLI